jgi:hypothetical protein
MDKMLETAKRQWQDVANLVLGVWLIASPWILEFTAVDYALANAYIIGAIVAVAAAAALVKFQEWEEWVNAVLGLWLIASPWLLEFAAATATAETQAAFYATWTFIVTGVLVIGLAGWSAWNVRQHGAQAT